MDKQIEQIIKLVKCYQPETVEQVEDVILNSPSWLLFGDLISEYIFNHNDGEIVEDEFSLHPLFNDILDEVCCNLSIFE